MKLVVYFGCLTILSAHEPITTKLTWTQEISRIVYNRCAGCHREGGAAPMSLITYEETRPWAKAIRDEVLERRMPPWGAVKGFGQFRDDPSLTQPEIDMIVNWVEGGAPKGDDIYLPSAPRTFPPPKKVKNAGGIAIRGRLTLERDLLAAGIAPQAMRPGSQMRVIARFPDGSVDNLIWLRNSRQEWRHDFYFQEPLRFPKGTLLQVDSAEPVSAVILTAKRAR